MDITVLIAISVMLIPGFLYFGKIQLLNNRKHWAQVAFLACVAAAISITLLFLGAVDPVAAIALTVPLYQLMLFRAFYALFVYWKRREPKDCSIVFSTGLAADRTFSMIYVLMAIGSPFILIGPMLWGTQHVA